MNTKKKVLIMTTCIVFTILACFIIQTKFDGNWFLFLNTIQQLLFSYLRHLTKGLLPNIFWKIWRLIL